MSKSLTNTDLYCSPAPAGISACDSCFSSTAGCLCAKACVNPQVQLLGADLP